MTSAAGDSARVATVKQFYDVSDGRRAGNRQELFTDDVVIHAPKFGVGTGVEAMERAGLGRGLFRRMAYHVDEFDIVEVGDRVIVEGTNEGETASGITWDGRTTVTGRFCTVFEFRGDRIARMFTYFDPDLGNEDAGRYPW